jgi:hypothetical protein
MIFNTEKLWPEIAEIVETDPLFSKLPTSLLSVSSDSKTVKGEKIGILTGILYLSPANTCSPCWTMCAYARIAQCEIPCLDTAGRGGMNSVKYARIRKTLMFKQYNAEFLALLVRDIERLQRKAKKRGLIPAVRLNGTSDVQWEYQKIDGRTLFEIFPDIRWYDYSKIPNRKVPENYHITFSYSGISEFQPVVQKQLNSNPTTNLAVVFDGTLPANFLGRPVVNGDDSDVRFYDKPGVIVGLTAKGDAKKDHSGFVVRSV